MKERDTFYCMLRVSCFPSDNVRKSLMPVFSNNILPFSSAECFRFVFYFFSLFLCAPGVCVLFLNFRSWFSKSSCRLSLCLVHSFIHTFVCFRWCYLLSAFWLCFPFDTLSHTNTHTLHRTDQINRTHILSFMWNV